MIHFDFIVNDVDAENIINCITNEASRSDKKILDAIAAGDTTLKEAYIKDRDYLLSLRDKMKNTRLGRGKGLR